MKKLLIYISIISLNISAQLILPSVFSDNMVLQRDMKIPVWGKAASEAEIIVKFHGQIKITSADKEGNWKVYLSPISADCSPQKMSIESELTKIVFTNVLVGEVWLCSGQSNMEFELKSADDAQEFIASATNNNIRFFQAGRHNFKPYECDNCSGKWKVSSPDTVGNLTAVGYFFGLMNSLTDKQLLTFSPDQSIIIGNTGSEYGNEGMFSSCIIGIRSSSENSAMIYTANGSDFQIDLSKIIVDSKKSSLRARWFNPRNGQWSLIGNNILNSGSQTMKFDPPGIPENVNDWVLVLDTDL